MKELTLREGLELIRRVYRKNKHCVTCPFYYSCAVLKGNSSKWYVDAICEAVESLRGEAVGEKA